MCGEAKGQLQRIVNGVTSSPRRIRTFDPPMVKGFAGCAMPIVVVGSIGRKSLPGEQRQTHWLPSFRGKHHKTPLVMIHSPPFDGGRLNPPGINSGGKQKGIADEYVSREKYPH